MAAGKRRKILSHLLGDGKLPKEPSSNKRNRQLAHQVNRTWFRDHMAEMVTAAVGVRFSQPSHCFGTSNRTFVACNEPVAVFGPSGMTVMPPRRRDPREHLAFCQRQPDSWYNQVAGCLGSAHVTVRGMSTSSRRPMVA
jgi:hypothetical protein